MDLTEAEDIKKWQGYTEELWMEVHDIVQEAVIKAIPKKKKCQKEKWLADEAFKSLRKEERQKAKEKRKDIPI